MLCCLIAKPETQLHENGESFVLEKKCKVIVIEKKSLGGFSIELTLTGTKNQDIFWQLVLF